MKSNKLNKCFLIYENINDILKEITPKIDFNIILIQKDNNYKYSNSFKKYPNYYFKIKKQNNPNRFNYLSYKIISNFINEKKN